MQRQTNEKTKPNGFLSLCYHYIRPKAKNDPFSRLLGIQIEEFEKHILMLKKNFKFISLKEAKNFLYNDYSFKDDNCGMLITFDDGLSDHFTAAQILAENEIKGVFFVPTCIFEENLPANPIIIHYTIARFGIKKFLAEYEIALQKTHSTAEFFYIKYKDGDDVWKTISEIKLNFKYKFDPKRGREILLHIYDQLFLKEYPNAMKIMHLTKQQVRKMIKMGHTFGTHSHTHISIRGGKLNEMNFQKEVIFPKKYLESTFNTKVNSMSYPFGQKDDCLSTKEFISRTASYKLAFTVEQILNTKKTSPYEIGRLQPHSTDSSATLNNALKQILTRSRFK